MSSDMKVGNEGMQYLSTSPEPDWFLKMREESLEAAQAYAYPEWDRTRSTDFPLSSLAAQVPAVADRYQPTVPSDAQTAGVVCCDLFTAMQSHQELVRRHLASVVLPREDKFTATHYAYLNNGFFVYVPRDVDVTIPLDLTYPLANNEQMSCVHTLIVVERGARVQIVEQIQDCSSSPGPIIHVAEVVAAPGSNIHYTTIQNTPVGSRYFAMRRAILDRDARMEWVLSTFGGKLSIDSTETVLRGDGCEANSLLMFFGNGEQHFDIRVAMEHEGLHTTSDILGRGVCDNHARGIYRANTHISNGAHFTSAYQRQNTLLLTKEARADAIPALTIDDDEVQAGHAATVGQIDTDQLFYLMSRGLPASDAIRMVALGFVDPVLQRIPSPEKRDLLQQLIDRKMTL